MAALGLLIVITGIVQSVYTLPAGKPVNFGRNDGKKDIVSPKVMIVGTFDKVASIWLNSDYKLTALNITVPGFSARYPNVNCNAAGNICHMTTDEGVINAVATLTALVDSPFFNLKQTYFFLTGIAGINPSIASVGSAAFAKYAVQVDLTLEFAAHDVPADWPIWLMPLGAKRPNTYPGWFYGTEVYELNEALLNRAFAAASKAKLVEDSKILPYRKLWKEEAAQKSPSVVKCDTASGNVYWKGKVLGEYFANYTKIVTNGNGKYCTTQQEDNGSLTALVRGAARGVVDFGRIVLLRTAANFDRPSPGISAVEQFFGEKAVSAGGMALKNILVAGKLVVDDIVNNWDKVYASGIKATNYIGDVFNTLNNPMKSDIQKPAIPKQP